MNAVLKQDLKLANQHASNEFMLLFAVNKKKKYMLDKYLLLKIAVYAGRDRDDINNIKDIYERGLIHICKEYTNFFVPNLLIVHPTDAEVKHGRRMISNNIHLLHNYMEIIIKKGEYTYEDMDRIIKKSEYTTEELTNQLIVDYLNDYNNNIITFNKHRDFIHDYGRGYYKNEVRIARKFVDDYKTNCVNQLST